MVPTLQHFPEAFRPLVVVLGDRRETRPKTRGDLLAYSVSTVDILYLNSLRLPPDTLVLSDKVSVLESREWLREKFGDSHILTIGSPATNLFSRMINDESLFRFQIDEGAKEQMSRQEAIVDRIKRDPLGLAAYKSIVEQGAKQFDDFARAFRGRILMDDQLAKRFDEIYKEVQKTGLDNYRELLRAFEGKGILDPIREGRLVRENPTLRGASPHDYNDFGFVSIARHPFSGKDDKVVIYAAGRHGPATSHSIELLSKNEVWKRWPYGGVFEIQMGGYASFSQRFQDVTPIWETDPYAVEDFSLETLRKSDWRQIRIFLSTRFRWEDNSMRDRVGWLMKTVETYYAERGMKAICGHPYDAVGDGEWNYVTGIIKHFPPSSYIVHDVTDYSPGVVFEIGCSIGLNKKFILIWNESEKEFPAKSVPRLLRRTHIERVRFTDAAEAEQSMRRLLASVDSATLSTQCPGLSKIEGSSSCPYPHGVKNRPPVSDRVFVVINKKWRKLMSRVSKGIRDHGFSPVEPNDFHEEDVELCRVCKGIATCKAAVVDVTHEDKYGLLSLGIARARDCRILELYQEGTEGSSMFDGVSRTWRDETLDDDVEEALKEIL